MAPQREWFEKDYYATLGIDPSSTAKEVTSAYRKLARQNHPDANPGNAAAEERFKEITAAYEVIGNEAKRKEYDEVRQAVRAGAAGGPGGFGTGPGGFNFNAGGADMGDLLGDLFGRMGGESPRGRSARQNQGSDLETELHISLLDSVRGMTTKLTIPSTAQCPDCSGSGAALGTSPRKCDVCDGRGVTQENQGLFGFSRPCSNCGGRGSVVDNPCQMCRGQGTVSRPEEVRLRIPEGIESGKVLRVPGKGGQGPMGQRGDLFVRVLVDDNPTYTRDGNDLRTTVPVLFTEAALGANITVTAIDGDHITIRLPEGSQTGRTLRVRGRGVPHSGGKGDLLVKVRVVVPKRLTPEQRTALEAFAETYQENPRKPGWDG